MKTYYGISKWSDKTIKKVLGKPTKKGDKIRLVKGHGWMPSLCVLGGNLFETYAEAEAALLALRDIAIAHHQRNIDRLRGINETTIKLEDETQ